MFPVSYVSAPIQMSEGRGAVVASADVFAAIAAEVAGVLDVPLVALWRHEPDGTATVVGAWSSHTHPFRAPAGDDGVGGARPEGGTVVAAEIPVPARASTTGSSSPRG
jgi:hypothetical protein